jgi:hypothetical protein
MYERSMQQSVRFIADEAPSCLGSPPRTEALRGVSEQPAGCGPVTQAQGTWHQGDGVKT